MKIDRIQEKLNNMLYGIDKAAIYTNGRVPKFWQLYLDAKVEDGLNNVDTCATSQCLSVLASADYKESGILDEAVASVVRLRNKEGSWPSAITVDELIDPTRRMKGDTAIGDNCFALTALIDSGFLESNFKYGSKLPELSNDFQNIEFRVEFVIQAVDWLLGHKAQDGVGWYFTDNIDEGKQSVALTTLNVLQVLSTIIFKLNKFTKDNALETTLKQQCEEYVKKLTEVLKETIEVFIAPSNIYDDIQRDWKAIGTQIKSSKPSIIHTCKLVNLILFNKQYNGISLYDDVDDFINFIVDNTESLEKFETCCSDFYFEHYNLHKLNALGLPARTIQVDHENYAEGIVLYTLTNLKLYGIVISEKSISNLVDGLIRMMNPLAPNFYRCRSKRAAEINCWYPVYASYEAYRALENYIKCFKVNTEEPTNDIIQFAIKKVKEWTKNHSSSNLTVVPTYEYNKIISSLESIPTHNINENGRVDDAKTFVWKIQSMDIKIEYASISKFIVLIAELANQITCGSLE